MDLETVSDELYGLRPGDFTAARNERAKAARSAGDRELAEQIRRLRRPTLAAWAGNLLVRQQPDENGCCSSVRRCGRLTRIWTTSSCGSCRRSSTSSPSL
ncbi:hypothetical protein ACLGIH_34035 [Streptomyces sp. HMX87]|uniref:hypothetical protein n=1 Tax=Streptomyces sp. HMX87 TaxID=3390849 RepID=UPI003A8395CE